MSEEEMCPVHNRPYRIGRQMAHGIVTKHCAWDGSLHPDIFMELLEKPGVQLTPTDKNYKVYVEFEDHADAEELRIVSVANYEQPREGGWILGSEIPSEVDVGGWDDLSNSWVQLGKRGSKKTEKFYFEHLNKSQRERFVDMLNDKQIGLAFPGHFYNLPFFISHGT